MSRSDIQPAAVFFRTGLRRRRDCRRESPNTAKVAGRHRPDKILAKQAAKGPGRDEYVGEGQTLRLMRPEEAAEIEQRNRSRHRFMTPEEYRRQQEEQASHMGRMSRFKLCDPNERDEHAGLVSHSIPVPHARDTRDR